MWGKKMGVKGCINKTNITKYSRRHLSYFLCPTALPCPVLWAKASVPFSSGQFIPSTGQVAMSLFFFFLNPSDGSMQLPAR